MGEANVTENIDVENTVYLAWFRELSHMTSWHCSDLIYTLKENSYLNRIRYKWVKFQVGSSPPKLCTLEGNMERRIFVCVFYSHQMNGRYSFFILKQMGPQLDH